MLYPIEERTGSLLWTCPRCGGLVRYPNIESIALAERAGLCKDCRAEKTIRKKPELAWLLYDFSKRSGITYAFLSRVEDPDNDRIENNTLPSMVTVF